MTKANILDKFVATISPKAGLSRLKNRYAFDMLSGGYKGASKTRDGLSGWNTTAHDADADILQDLPTLRDRSRSLVRNNPIAAGSIHNKVTNIVGTGLKPNVSIDREFLGLSDEEADRIEAIAEREFNLWANSQLCDVEQTLTFPEHQDLALRSVLENGDHIVLLTKSTAKNSIYSLALQHVEADRLCNENNAADRVDLAGGVQKSKSGAPEFYHILDGHPGNRYAKSMTWTKVPAFGGETGRRVTLHLYRKLRAGQTRGVPDLAPVIEPLKQLDRYTDAEIDAAVKTALYALLVKTESGEGMAGLNYDTWLDTRKEYYKDNKLNMKEGSSVTLGLFPDDEVIPFDPTRPNTAYDPFMQAMYTQIGMALELPKEVLTKAFQSSYSAARASLLQAWQFFNGRRRWLAINFCQPIYETLFTEAVLKGRINAPGFLNDPLIRAAYLGVEWIGDAQGQIDETKAISAAKERIALGISTLKKETAALTGDDYDKVRRQRSKEKRQDDMTEQKQETEADVPSAEDLDDEDIKQMVRHG